MEGKLYIINDYIYIFYNKAHDNKIHKVWHYITHHNIQRIRLFNGFWYIDKNFQKLSPTPCVHQCIHCLPFRCSKVIRLLMDTSAYQSPINSLILRLPSFDQPYYTITSYNYKTFYNQSYNSDIQFKWSTCTCIFMSLLEKLTKEC